MNQLNNLKNTKSNPVKVALQLNTSWYIYNFRKNLIIELQKAGYEVYAIAPFDSYSKKLEDLGCIYYELEINSKSKNPLYDFNLLWRMRNVLSEIQPDVLLNFTIKPNIYGSIAARTLGIKCINNIAGMGTLYTAGSLSRFIFKALFKVSHLKVKTIFFQNPNDIEELTKNNIIKKKNARLLPGSGVNLVDFPYTPPEKKNNNYIEFLLLARMLYTKGIAELVEAGKLLSEKGYTNFHINLLGETGINNPQAIPEEELNRICEPPFVTYLGKTDDVKTYIIKADVVVLPSYYREGTPKSLLEALGIGRPIITTNMPGCKETVINGKNGYLCNPKSSKDLASKMEKFISLNFDQRVVMGKRSRKLAEENFDEKIVIDSYLKAIEGALFE